jgi:maltooligosyltrehalose trehalohydrolase
MKPYWQNLPGARYLGNKTCRFRVWAPNAQKVEVKLLGSKERLVPLDGRSGDYHESIIDGVAPGTLYLYRLDGAKERPDPASRFQPQGVHGPSQVVDPNFDWQDQHWYGLPLRDYATYELHVGTFTPEGTFDAVIPHLDGLKDLGITAVEIMPVAQFPGSRNWGYDGTYLYGVQNSYGGPDGLRRLVNACHQRRLPFILDVVYNHLGPEGNYLGDYGPYFTDLYKTPWGPAINYDGSKSDDVRSFFIGNALYWQTEFHVDALRLDAVHAIRDFSAYPFLQELADETKRQADTLNRRFFLISESDLNDTRVLRPADLGGFGHDAQWSDDFHHAVHTLLTGEHGGYYEDFGNLEHLASAWRDGFAYGGRFSVHRRRRHGNPSRQRPAQQFVICTQNHDQVGNRMFGERLSQLVDFDSLKLAAVAVVLSPYLPLLFMGEEYGETAPFQFFVSHGDAALIEAVRKGRAREFASFQWQGEIPDPQDEKTFRRCQLNHELKQGGQHRVLLEFYQELFRLRREIPALAHLSKDNQEVVGFEREKALYVRRWDADNGVFLVCHFGKSEAALALPVPEGEWRLLLNSGDGRWQGKRGRVAADVSSTGQVTINMPARTAVCYQKT